jgi:NADH-quinone oxidoreductase subunit E
VNELETPAPSLAEQGESPALPAAMLAELRELAARYPQARSALLPMLHLVQSVEGYVTPAGIEACADVLAITPAEVSAVATFYTMYKRRPVGTYHVGVCTNTLCAVMGGDLIFDRLKDHLDVGNDETTDDGAITLEHIECNAACDYAPMMTVNWELFDNQTPDSAVDLVERLRSGEVVQATRGARVVSWQEAERVLAGFPDDRADEGPAAGPASLLGLRLARTHDWHAPEPGDGDSSGGTDGSAVGAAQQADTSRAESETEVAASPADTADSAKPTPDKQADGPRTAKDS